jgi:hypothetical protein
VRKKKAKKGVLRTNKKAQRKGGLGGARLSLSSIKLQ